MNWSSSQIEHSPNNWLLYPFAQYHFANYKAVQQLAIEKYEVTGGAYSQDSNVVAVIVMKNHMRAILRINLYF